MKRHQKHNKLMMENVTKTYKSGKEYVAEGIRDRINIMEKTPAFITFKDYKDNFESNPKCHLINPSKSELGRVSKISLDDINNRLGEKLKVNQWKNSNSVINWFNSIENKPNQTFL